MQSAKANGHGHTREIFDGQSTVRLCLAKRKWCPCGYRFRKTDGPATPKDISVRNDVDYPQSKLGYCPECGRDRRLCRKTAVHGKLVCEIHGGRAGRKPLIPLVHALDDGTLDEIAAMQEVQDEGLEREFYVVKHMLQTVLQGYDPAVGDFTFVERYAKLLETAVSIKERRAKLRLLVPPEEANRKLEFTDPRVQLILKEKFKDAYVSTVRGTLALVFERLAGDAELTKRLYESLPERFQEYVDVPAAPGQREQASELGSPDSQ